MVGVRDQINRGWLSLAGILLVVLPACYRGYPHPGQEQDGLGTGPTPAGDDTGSAGEDSGTDGDTDGAGPEGGQDCAGEAEWTKQILTTNCAGCHSGAAAQGGFDFVDDLTRLTTAGLIKGGDPQNSPLFRKIADGQMPPPGIGQALDAEQQARLSDFIEFCADEPLPECEDNQPVPFTDQLQAMVQDLSQMDPDDRAFTRYLSLTHLYNAGYCDDEIDLYRHAVAKLVNALSSGPVVVAPVPIDDVRTIYRIDLRDYEWDDPFGEFQNRWEALVDFAPYTVERLEDEAETLQTFAGTSFPFLLGDAFIEVASQPPLYHDLVGIPATLQELENSLGLSIADNVVAEQVQRAGVLDSGVSRQNRIIERHDVPLGFGRSLWVSYDFSDDSQEEQNIFSSPLDFQEAGGEVIFNLPNGMQAYALVDAEGNRIDIAPDSIVVDPRQEDQNVHNGISCFGCHSGIIPAIDEVRDHVLNGLEFDAQTKDTVAAIYPDADVMQVAMDSDTERYQAAMAQAGVPAQMPLEPVSEAFLRYRFNITLRRAAAELGISEETLLTQLGGLDPALGPLATGSVKRDTFTEVYAQTVCALRLGVTEACVDDPPLPPAEGDTDDGAADTDGTTGGETDGTSGG